MTLKLKFIFVYQFTFLFFALLLGCNASGNSKKARGAQTRNVPINNYINLKSMIQGRWGGLRDTESSFAITGDTIFYYDNAEAFHYSLTNDKIKIEDGEDDVWKIKMTGNDSFTMIGTGKNKGIQDTLRRCNN